MESTQEHKHWKIAKNSLEWVQRFGWFSGKQWLWVLGSCGITILILEELSLDLLVVESGSVTPERVGLTIGIAFVMVTAVALIAGVIWLFNQFFRWANNPSASLLDALSFGIIFGFSVTVYSLVPNVGWNPATLAIAALLIMGLRVYHGRTRPHAKGVKPALLDRPLEEFSGKDAYGRGGFVDGFVQMLVTESCEVSRVLGIDGGWGTGKTTLVKEIGRRLQFEAPEVRAIMFQSWYFRESGKILDGLMKALAANIEKHHLGLGSARLFKKYAVEVSGMLPSGEWLKRVAAVIDAPEDLDSQKKAIDNLVAQTGDRFVVFIDDVERLPGQEIRDLLKAVRLCAAIPGITYVLVYDRIHLDLQLGGTVETAALLDKVLDEEFPIPLITERQHLEYIKKTLGKVVEGTPVDLADDFKGRFALALGLLRTILNTPRQVKRTALTFRRIVDRMSDRINHFDLLLVVVLRQRNRALYEKIKHNRDLFCKEEWSSDPVSSTAYGTSSRQTKRQVDRKTLITDLKIASEFESLLEQIFPDTASGQFDEQDYRRLRRVYHPEYFDRYFVFDPEAFTDVAVEKAVKKICNAKPGDLQKTVDELFSDVAELSQLSPKEIFEWLRCFAPQFQSGNLMAIARAFSKCAVLAEGKANRMVSLYVTVAQLISDLLVLEPSGGDVTNFLIDVISGCPDYVLAKDMFVYAKLEFETIRRRGPAMPKLDFSRCQTALDERIVKEFFSGKRNALMEPDYVFDALTYASDKAKLREYFYCCAEKYPEGWVVLARRHLGWQANDNGKYYFSHLQLKGPEVTQLFELVLTNLQKVDVTGFSESGRKDAEAFLKDAKKQF